MPARNNVTKFISYLALVICSYSEKIQEKCYYYTLTQLKQKLTSKELQNHVNNKWKDLPSNAIKKNDNGNVRNTLIGVFSLK
jgi:hypothetical protein